MSRLSATASLEAKLLRTFRELLPNMQVVGLLETADAGKQKVEDVTALQVRVYNFAQTNEGMGLFTASAELRLNVEQAESADGCVFFSAHETVALELERLMMRDNCTELETDEAFVDGFQRTDDDKDFDTTTGEWFAVWNLTISGRIKEQQEETDNG